MELSYSQQNTVEQSGVPEQRQDPKHDSSLKISQSPTACSKQQHRPCHKKQTKRLHHEKKRLRLQKKTVLEAKSLKGANSDCASESSQDMAVSNKKGTEASTSLMSTLTMEVQKTTPKQKRERKQQKPGKYVCTYCGRACAKPSVLQKHIRSHTGERPYPCAPCGFSFKTKSNLYKHRKSHTHRVKAGMTSGTEGLGKTCHDETVTESEEESCQLSSSLTLKKQGDISSQINSSTEISCQGQTQGLEYSNAVKKRLALRLSKARQTPLSSSDETSLSFGLGSKGSTESGYFSHSESTEVSQESPPNTSAKSYAEVIFGKFGRLGHFQRTVRQHQEHAVEQEGRSMSFSVPKKQVIDHITKLITINEAVVDTSKIDSVKPRRCPPSRKTNTESSLSKETIICKAKQVEISSKSSGSITLGVPCEKFLNVHQPTDDSSMASLMRSQSLPSGAKSSAKSTGCLQSIRLSQSFDKQQPIQNRHHGVLRRQSAIELPIGAKVTSEEDLYSSSALNPSLNKVSEFKLLLESFECEECGTVCNNWEKYKTHKHHKCSVHQPDIPTFQEEDYETLYKTQPGALEVRKRRKEESLELDDHVLPSVAFSSSFTSQGYIACEKATTDSIGSQQTHENENTLKGISVIQHTSLFNKLGTKLEPNLTHDTLTHSYLKEHTSRPNVRRLVRQQNVQIPEILVAEETKINVSVLHHTDVTEPKQSKNIEDFQWPQQSPSLAQLPIEKLPPKKKRLRLAEAAQSSRDSSFESSCVSRSPSKDSFLPYNHSTLIEDTVRSNFDMTSRRSRAAHTFSIPTGSHHLHRELQRSASEHVPHISKKANSSVDNRSKSFDYSCLTPDRISAGWTERRKCLQKKHSAVKEPEDVDVPPKPSLSINPTFLSTHNSESSHASVQSTFHNISLGNTLCTTFSLKADTHLPSLAHTVQHSVGKSSQCLATALYYSVSTGLKLKIPKEDNVGQSAVSVCPILSQHSNLEINPSQGLLRSFRVQRVPVRVHSDLSLNFNYIYTTMSQNALSKSQDSSCSDVRLDCEVARFDFTDLHSVGEGSKVASTGGTKRVLSPTSSVELTSDSLQQKRLKEEENSDKAMSSIDDVIANKKEESQLCTENIMAPVDKKELSFPSLDTKLAISWCYLNYIKPNPSALSGNQKSVYSSWCISPRNPNPQGLSSKEVLSLVYCKQRDTSFTYTMAAMPPSTVGNPREPDSREHKAAKVYAPESTAHLDFKKAELTKTDNTLKCEEDGENQSTSISYEIPRVPICEGGCRLREELVYVRGRGRGRYVCEECGIRCRKPSTLRKHIRLHTDSRPYICQHCNFAFKTKGNLTKHKKSKAHGKICPEETMQGLSESVLSGCGAEKPLTAVKFTEEHQFSDVDVTDEEEDEDKEEGDEKAAQSSATSVNRLAYSEVLGSSSTSAAFEKKIESSPNTSSSVKTNNAAISSSPTHSHGLHLFPGPLCPSPWDAAPLCCLSPRLSHSPSPCQSSLFPSNRPVSPFSSRHLSPVQAMSPICPMSPSSPLSSTGASMTVQQKSYKHRDLGKSSLSKYISKGKLDKCSDERKEHQAKLLFYRESRAREDPRVFSHLPLHSQPQVSSSSLSLIPIGGIQMVQIPLIRSDLHPHQSETKFVTQMCIVEQDKIKNMNKESTTELPQCDSVKRQELDNEKKDAQSVLLTTWKCISQSRERKRKERKLTHNHIGAMTMHNMQTSTDSDATPKSSWKEKAFRISEKTKSE